MLTFDQAKQLILQQIPHCPSNDPMEEWVIDDSHCHEYPDYWYIWGNARGFVEYGDTSYLLVGSNGYLVDKISHEIIALGSLIAPQQYIRDRQDERAAAGKHYVLRYRQPENPQEQKRQFLQLKQMFSCNYRQAQQLQYQPEWLSTRLFTLQEIQTHLSQYHIATEIILCEKLPEYTIIWQNHCGEEMYLPQKLAHFIHDIKNTFFRQPETPQETSSCKTKSNN